MRSKVKVYQKSLVERRRKRALLFCSTILVSFLILTGLLSWVSHLEGMQASSIRIEGNEKLTEQEVSLILESYTQGKYAYLFPKTNVILYPKSTIRSHIESIPAVKEINLKIEGWNTVVVQIEEKKEEALFCNGAKKDMSNCYFVDENGFAFASSVTYTNLSPADKLYVYRDQTKDVDPVGAQAIDRDAFMNLQFFMRELSGLKVNPEEVIMGEVGYVTVVISGGGELIVNTSDDLSTVLSNLASVISDVSVVPSLQDFLSNLDYIRLDSGNKVFYKLRE